MKSTLLSLTFAAAALAAVAVPAHATSVDFQGNCIPISHTCDFDSGRGSGTACTAPLTITAYSWSFTNNTGTATGATATHTFASSAGGSITLQITCSDNSTASKTRSACFSFGFPGCIIPDNDAWN
ncbi:MAG TPA: hypothetical protein VH988_20055 [Thermoanaerobaculia bacterium]|jgi:hypothetical protein|nr:hypothetical protein [Thermoanaerobaculia bacterium]